MIPCWTKQEVCYFEDLVEPWQKKSTRKTKVENCISTAHSYQPLIRTLQSYLVRQCNCSASNCQRSLLWRGRLFGKKEADRYHCCTIPCFFRKISTAKAWLKENHTLLVNEHGNENWGKFLPANMRGFSCHQRAVEDICGFVELRDVLLLPCATCNFWGYTWRIIPGLGYVVNNHHCS